MRITRLQIRKMLKEAMSPTDPQSLYTRYVELQNSKTNPLAKLGEDVYNELYELVNQALEADDGYNGYSIFHDKVRVAPFKLHAGTAYGLYHPNDRARGRTMPPWEVIQDQVKELEDLKSQFETQDSTDQADLRYGRRRSKIIHKPTGTVISNDANRAGSLGT